MSLPALLVRTIALATGIRPDEARAVLVSGAYFFFLLSAYYVIRPIREEMAVAGGVENIPWLFTCTLAGTLLVHPLFAGAVSRQPRRRFVSRTYRFAMANLVVFFVVMKTVPDSATVWVGRVFFVWVAVFNLFVVSVFWSFMTDVFRERQSRRLFGLVSAGGGLGAIAGSAITGFAATSVGPVNLLWFSVVLIECAVYCVKRLDNLAVPSAAGSSTNSASDRGLAADPGPASDSSPVSDHSPASATASLGIIGGSAWDGIKRLAGSRYLLGISAFMMLFTIGSTFLYQIQAAIVSTNFAGPAERTAVFARLDLAVNVLSLLAQAFLTGRLIKWMGVGATLALLPLISVVGFAALGAAPVLGAVPVLTVFVIFQVLRRAGDYAVARPTREVLYTVLSRNDKYKAKNFNDTFVYRAGDQVGAWSFAGMSALGLGTSALALTMAPLSAVWLLVALWLGRRQVALAAGARGSVRTPRSP